MPHDNRMKISKTHYDELRDAIIHAKPRLDQYREGLAQLRKTSEVQYRWEVWHITNATTQYQLGRTLSNYLTDDQLDTALIRIIDDLEQIHHYVLTIKGHEPLSAFVDHFDDNEATITETYISKDETNYSIIQFDTEFDMTIRLNEWFNMPPHTTPFPNGTLLLWTPSQPYIFSHVDEREHA